MLLFKCIKNRRKLKIVLFLLLIAFIVATIVFLNSSPALLSRERLLDERFIAAAAAPYVGEGRGEDEVKVTQASLVQSQQERVPIIPEKYDEHKIKARIIKDKIKTLKEHHQRQQEQNAIDPDEEHTHLDVTISAVHIFYSAPVQWYKNRKMQRQQQRREEREQNDQGNQKQQEQQTITQQLQVSDGLSNASALLGGPTRSARVLNSAFYPALGLYKPTIRLLQQHFENIRRCGIGVLILAYTGTKAGETELYERILNLAPNYNLSVTFEFSLSSNQSQAFVRQQLRAIRHFSTSVGFHRVYSISRNRTMPVLYIGHAYKLSDPASVGIFCGTDSGNERKAFDAFFVGHIKLKSHADNLRRLCFDGFYSRLPSNGATYASTWKNWSYLKTYAQTYNMLFVPTVGPGFAERNKFPRHGDVQRHRSNGRYYGVAWRTAIINHVGFISIASYNNWQDGSQIEEVLPKAGFLDYSPGSKTKYLDLTTHWVRNLLKVRREATAGRLNCYELLNNTIC